MGDPALKAGNVFQVIVLMEFVKGMLKVKTVSIMQIVMLNYSVNRVHHGHIPLHAKNYFSRIKFVLKITNAKFHHFVGI